MFDLLSVCLHGATNLNVWVRTFIELIYKAGLKHFRDKLSFSKKELSP